MTCTEIRKGIYAVGAIDWDRRLFDELIPLPDGTTYNSYLIMGADKTVLIDTVDPTKQDDLLRNLAELGIKKIDYVVSQHAEQDHSGAIPAVLKTYPEAKVLTNQKCKDMLIEHLSLPDDAFVVVHDGQDISLGDKTLRFILAPWVHWPETMFTYLKEDGILFSCDLFGGHFAASSLYADDECKAYHAAKRYYAEIMMPFRGLIRQHLEKLKAIKIDLIAASHGPIYKKPSFIIDAYYDWTSENVKQEVVIAYVSMHGSTALMVRHLSNELIKRGLSVRQFDIPRTDIGELAIALVDASTLILATPTVLGGAHPSAAYVTMLANALRPKLRYAAVIGSYGWGGRTVEQIGSMIGNLKVEVIGAVLSKGMPKAADYQALEKLAEKVAEKNTPSMTA